MKTIQYKVDPQYIDFLKSKEKEILAMCANVEQDTIVIQDDYAAHNITFGLRLNKDVFLIYFGIYLGGVNLNLQVLDLNKQNKLSYFNLNHDEFLHVDDMFKIKKRLNLNAEFSSKQTFKLLSIDSQSQDDVYSFIINQKETVLEFEDPYEYRYFNIFINHRKDKNRIQVCETVINENNLNNVLKVIKSIWN